MSTMSIHARFQQATPSPEFWFWKPTGRTFKRVSTITVARWGGPGRRPLAADRRAKAACRATTRSPSVLLRRSGACSAPAPPEPRIAVAGRTRCDEPTDCVIDQGCCGYCGVESVDHVALVFEPCAGNSDLECQLLNCAFCEPPPTSNTSHAAAWRVLRGARCKTARLHHLRH